jgi:four helix bundle protein
MEKTNSYKDLQVWKVSMEFVIEVYKLTSLFPKTEIYGLTNQIRRSSVSIPSNIAEGSGRKNLKEFIHFLYISKASLLELETQIEISKRLGYINDVNNLNDKIKYIRIMLVKLIHSLEKTSK